MDSVRQLLTEAIRDKKLRHSADEILRDLQARSTVDVVYNDPERRAKNPQVAAVVNGQPITVAELADECIERHGQEILEHFINRRLIEQEAKKRNVQVTPQEIEAEIAQTALLAGKIMPDGRPDIAALMAALAEEGITRDMYVHDTVWPTCALKKFVAPEIAITDEDLQRGFEANYGPRVRCRAIVINSMRRAQEVWEMARKNPSIEYFGELAQQYSVEANTRSLRGEIPPIQRWGGQPALESEAFALKPGELSGVVQVGDHYVILLCEGYTEPKQITMAEVRDLIYEDIFEKKQRMAMAREFDRIRQDSQIDNFLANTSHMPNRRKRNNESLDPQVAPAGATLPTTPRAKPEPPRAGSVKDPQAAPVGALPNAMPLPAAPPAAAKLRPNVSLPPTPR
jgi:parvulin-like peptidyl-prolyl isomerase